MENLCELWALRQHRSLPRDTNLMAAGGPPIPAFYKTHKTVGAPSFAAFAKGGIPHSTPFKRVDLSLDQ